MGKRVRYLSLIGAALMIAGPLAFAADAAANANANGNVGQDIDWDLAWSCNNKTANVSASGAKTVGLGRLKANFRGANGVTEQRDIDASIAVALKGNYSSPKSPSEMGAGGNPYIWFQSNGGGPSILLGRCNEASSKQLIKKATLRNIVALSSLASVGASGCNNSSGPDISVSKGDRGATSGRVWFSNQNTVDPAHQTTGSLAYGDFKMDMSASVSKGGAHSGVTGNPYIKFAFAVDLDGNGNFGGVDKTQYGVDGEYYTADGTWTSDVNAAFGAERRCVDFGK